MILSKRPCPECRGTGRRLDGQIGLCPHCNGEGKRAETKAEAKAREAEAARRADTCGCSLAVKGGCDGRCCY